MAKDRKLESPKIAPWVLAKIGELKRNPKNPRIIKDSRFKDAVKSIKAFPQMLQLRPIVVNAEMMILGGDKRYLASVEAGLLEVPIIIADNLTEAQQQEFIIKDNVGFGEWDWELLKDWDSLSLGEWGVELPEPETNNNREVAVFGFSTEMTIKLSFPEKTYKEVLSKLNAIDEDHPKALLTLLGLNNV